MTIELLEKRKQELLANQQKFVAEYQQAQAHANAVNGAIQDCDFWIGVLKAQAADQAATPPESTQQ